MTFDAINAIFELIAGILLMLNVKELLRSKRVVGVHIAPTAFFTLWGIWNVLYYPAISQPLSFYVAILVVVNGTWVVLAFKFNRR